MKQMTISKKNSILLSQQEALEIGLKERDFSLWEETNDAGNCLLLRNCQELLDIQIRNETNEEKMLSHVWNSILTGAKYDNENEDILNLIIFFNNIRFLKLNIDQYLYVRPREIPKDSLAYEVTLLIRIGINFARIVKYSTNKVMVERYKKANTKILQLIKEVHYHSVVSKKFKSFFPKEIGARLTAITSSDLAIDECRVDKKTMKLLRKRIGSLVMVTRHPILVVLGFSLKIVGETFDGCIQVRPELLQGLQGDTDGDQLDVFHSKDIIRPQDYLNKILEYYGLKIGDLIKKTGGIRNKDFIYKEKHAIWNRVLDKQEIIQKMDIQKNNLAYGKTATARAGYWSIIMSQYINEHREILAKRLNKTVEETMIEYRILLFIIQQSLVDSKHSDENANLSLPFLLTDIKLSFKNQYEIDKFLTDKTKENSIFMEE